MTVALKRGVKLRGMAPEILLAIMITDGVYADLGYDVVVTSICDSMHARGSLHYAGLAVDFRTRHLQDGDNAKIVDALKTKLGAEFDVVSESNHIHIEWQPKQG